MEFIEIESIVEFDYIGKVYDLAVEEDASYNIENIIVHNSACTTSANAAIHYPMASLISECFDIAQGFANPSKIVADGGFRKYSDIIKALALGADYVMIGGILSKTVEACSDNYQKDECGFYNKVEVTGFGGEIYKKYRGMSTKEVQSKWGKTDLKTAEGISKFNKVEYTLAGWTENFIDYLKSNMSYCGKRTLLGYCGRVQYVHITQNARDRFSK